MRRKKVGCWLRRGMIVALGAMVIGAASPAVSAATYVFSTDQSEFTPGVNNQGWWMPRAGDSDNPNEDGNVNYFVGHYGGGQAEHRNFFTFDLSTLDLTGQTIASARLDLTLFGYASDYPSETYELFDVSTGAATLNYNQGSNAKIWKDLGTGTSYGEFIVTPTVPDGILHLDLDAAALADIGAARGGFFSVGGAIKDLSGDTNRFLFPNSEGGGIQHLVIETLPILVPVTPEPTSLLLLGIGAVFMLALLTRGQMASMAEGLVISRP